MKRPNFRRGGTPPANLPMPELLSGERGENWIVKEGELGYTDMLDKHHKIMSAPVGDQECDMCDEEHDPSIRLHELLHAKFSPLGRSRNNFVHKAKKYHVADKYIAMTEEVRIDLIGKHGWPRGFRGIDEGLYAPACGPDISESIAILLDKGDMQGAAELLFLLRNTANSGDVGTNIVHDKMYDFFVSTLGIRVVNDDEYDDLEAEIRYGLEDFSLATLAEEYHEYFSKLSPQARKKFFERLVKYKHLSDNLYAVTHCSLADAHYGRVPRLRDISWSRVLRYAYELQEQLRLFAESETKMIPHAVSDLERITETGDSSESTLHGQTSKMETMMLTNNVSENIDTLETIKGKSREDLEEMMFLRDGRKKHHDARKESAKGQIRWAKMRIRRPKLTKKYPVHKLQRSHSRARDEGSVPRNLHRYVTDKRIFATKYKVYGASVLVDDSGSMGFTEQDLEEIMDLAPGSIVATYAGVGGIGDLRIVAENGRRVEGSVGVQYFGNQIDYPALEWLGEQPWPRIWISDGEVVSLSHGHSTRPYNECMDLCEAAGIELVPDARSAADFITGKLQPKRPKVGKYKRTMNSNKQLRV